MLIFGLRIGDCKVMRKKGERRRYMGVILLRYYLLGTFVDSLKVEAEMYYFIAGKMEI
jgi:hypothetical protein